MSETAANTGTRQYVVCRADEIAVGAAKRFSVAGRDIAIFNVNGDFAAIADRCPHEGASLCRGKIVGLAEADEPGKARMMREGEFVRCPWHGWEFDLKTGRSWCDPTRTRVKSFAVSVAGGSALREGPYRIEVYDVSLKDDYLVVTI